MAPCPGLSRASPCGLADPRRDDTETRGTGTGLLEEPMELRSALIVGAGSGLSASLARLFSRNGLQVALASRNPDRLASLAHETAATTFACEAAEPEEVAGLFDAVIATQGVPDVVVYNASARARGPVAELDPAEVARAIAVSAYAGFLVGQQAARHMLPQGAGAIL